MSTYFFDLDGPLLDVSPRYYQLYLDLLPQAGGACTPLSLVEYWQLKRKRVPEREIFLKSGVAEAAIGRLNQLRLNKIETPEYLVLDRAWEWSKRVLSEVRSLGKVVLVTQRNQRELLLAQLDTLGFDFHPNDVISGRGDETELAKAHKIRAAGLKLGEGDLLIGDTEVDVKSAQELKIAAIACATGIRERDFLQAQKPSALLDSSQDLADWIRARMKNPCAG